MAKKRALLIGNDSYTDSKFGVLTVPLNDVQGLEVILKRSEICGFDEVKLLQNASRTEAEEEIGSLFNKNTKDDLLLLYFSGHGFVDLDGELYLAMPETQHNQPVGTALDASFIKRAIKKSQSCRKILILDCCYSGAYARGEKGGGENGIGRTVLTKATFPMSGYGSAVLTSSSATQTSKEGEQIIGATDKSLFTHYLVEGLETGKAAAEGGETITLEEVYDYAYDHTTKAAAHQTPCLWINDQRGKLVFAQNPQPKPLGSKLRAELQSKMFKYLDIATDMRTVWSEPTSGIVKNQKAIERIERVNDTYYRHSTEILEFFGKIEKDIGFTWGEKISDDFNQIHRQLRLLHEERVLGLNEYREMLIPIPEGTPEHNPAVREADRMQKKLIHALATDLKTLKQAVSIFLKKIRSKLKPKRYDSRSTTKRRG